MDFIDQVKQFSKRVESLKDSLKTEEATKTAVVMPFFAMLGYDVFNPQEFVPEFTADVGIKKGEKVDYAILDEKGEAVVLIECKATTEKLEKHDSQLFRYFGTSSAKFAILTNGIQYRFFTDIDDKNKMDETPFLEIDIFDVRENQVTELKRFCKGEFDIDSIFSTASSLKYVHEFKKFFTEQLENPSDEMVKVFLQVCYTAPKTQNVIDKFRPLLQTALNDCISEMMNDKIKTALGGSGGSISATVPEKVRPTEAVEVAEDAHQKRVPNIVTTEEELEAYFILKNVLDDVCPMSEITYKDTESYFGILYKGNTRKWICRLKLTETAKTLILPSDEKFQLTDIYQLQDYKEQLAEVLKSFM